MTSGAARGAFTFVSGASTLGVGFGRVGNLVTFNAQGTPVQAPTPSPGDGYEICSLPSVREFDVDAYHDVEWHTGGVDSTVLRLQWLQLQGQGEEVCHVRFGGGANVTSSQSIQFVGCSPFGEVQAPVGVGAVFFGCRIGSSYVFNGGTWGFRWNAGGGPTFRGSVLDSMGPYSATEGSYFDGSVTFTGCQCLRALSFGVYGTPGGNAAITVDQCSRLWLDGCWGPTPPTASYGLDCQAYCYISGHVPTIIGLADDLRIGVWGHDWTDVPWKNTPPTQAQWSGGGAIQGTDTNDYHVLTK